MTDMIKAEVARYYDLVSTDYGRQYDRTQFETLNQYPQNYFRLQILVNRLAVAGARRVYEVGVGEGTPLAMMASMGFDVAGCDVSQAMVSKTIEHLKSLGQKNPDIQWADVEDCLTFANQAGEPYDAAFAFGVLPHVHKPAVMLSNLHALVGGKGKVFVEFRNKFFALTTFNRFTHDFIMNDLLGDVADDVKAKSAETIAAHVDMNLPPKPTGDGPDYGSIMANFHNPFELLELFEETGFENPRIHWYHYHPGLPRHEKELGWRWREEAMKLEHEASGWRGMFLCSAGVVEADAV